MDLAPSWRRRLLGLGAAIAAVAVLVAAIGIAAVVSIRSGIEQREVDARARLSDEFDSIALPDGFTLVRTERGGDVWNFPLEGSPGPFETRVFEIERDPRRAYGDLLSALQEQGFTLQRLHRCYVVAERELLDLTVTFSASSETGTSSSRCPEAGLSEGFTTLQLRYL